ncbi:MAG TPA: bifunctional glutamate N-acetyltransferase/amino-acid acetyltransferase ArgJ [Candidatus Omnitrophica bacterium]|nr:MAG: ornithine acetyltransferase [Candidatus Omnitrophota bacterium]RKY42352.1 MAG: ornithine acetyltransferase [Candidatus Omnitrophota bacterium]HEC69113.1 bifunctional glutamate N-acetyltransferase/amino-acid acetyltransferase ArgJ [Candidatus Omnitrophota bacterium]
MKAPKGLTFSGIHSGIKRKNLDLGLVVSEGFSDCVCFFTNNRVKANPIILNLNNLKINNSQIKAIIVNSGNANSFTGKQGLKDAQVINKKLSKLLNIKPEFILSASTGIIGKRLPVSKILKNLNRLVAELSPDNFKKFSQAILTTDTQRKLFFKEVKVSGEKVRILGIAKGAGMIYPQLNKATMLGFIFTDANIKRSLLIQACREAVDLSFNSISVDGCRSTNDSVFVLASKKSSSGIERKDKSFKEFSSQLKEVMLSLAKSIVKDAEGATKFIEIEINSAKTKEEARRAGLAIANSNLFKTAIYGENPNWGRIISALGQAQIPLKDNISIKYTSLKARGVKLKIDLKRGKYSWRVYTSDLTPEYIKINSNYS